MAVEYSKEERSMKIKWSILGCSLSLLIIGSAGQAVKAQILTDCGSKLKSFTTYGTYHQGPSLGFTGNILITKAYPCAKGTCFSASMTFQNSSSGANTANGFWNGSSIEFVRDVSLEATTQVWQGQCFENSVRGNWYYPANPNNGGSFSITY